MEKEQILTQIIKIFEQILKHRDFSITDLLSSKNISGYDSMAQISIISELEKKFEIRFQLKELAKMTTIHAMADIIQEKLP